MGVRSGVFTGLIEHLGVVVHATPTPTGLRLRVHASTPWPTPPVVGESIALDGCCLTLATPAAQHDPIFEFDVIPESLGKTTLGTLQPGSRVHLEPSATLQTLLGGHLVQGHVDGVGKVVKVIMPDASSTGEWRIRIVPPASLMKFIIPKGSICLQGVSLTIAAQDGGPSGGWFEVALIPTTIAKTTLGDLRHDSRVNLECDNIAKTVVHYLEHFMERRREGLLN